MQPTILQRIVADYRFPGLCVLLSTLAFSGWIVWSLDLSLTSLADPWISMSALGTLLLSFLTGWFISILFGWPLLGMFLMARGERNGGPFNVGDRVQIISGRFAGTVTTVYSKNLSPNYICVDLGIAAREQFRDIYSDHQLLRVTETGSNQITDKTTA